MSLIQLGPFRLEVPLGRGGMGEVWSGRLAGQETSVAVKILSADVLRDPGYRAAFRNEIRAVASLDHPNVVQIYEHGEVTEAEARQARFLVEGLPFLAMELAGGGPLTSLCGRLEWEEVRAVLLALLDALAHAHARGVIHRDLKPGNVLLGDKNPVLKLTDFGLAHALDRTGSSEVSDRAGTSAYMAPEQFVGEWRDFGPWTDLYALGCLAWSLISGGPPFRREDRLDAMRAHLSAPPPELKSRAAVPRGFEDWLRTLLEKDPAWRFQCAADAAAALIALDGSERIPANSKGPSRISRTPMGVANRAWSLQDVAIGGVLEAIREPDPSTTSTSVFAISAPRPGTVRTYPLPPLPTGWQLRRTAPTVRPPGIGLGLWGVRAMPLVGRVDERDVLWHALRKVHATGRSHVVVVRGPQGCGKSSVVRWLGRRAMELGAATVLRASHGPTPAAVDGIERMLARLLRCEHLSRDDVRYRVNVGLKPFGDVSESLCEAVVDLLAPQTDDGPPRDTVELTAPLGPAQRHAIVRRVIEVLCRQRPLVIWLEDVQWGLDALMFALRVAGRSEGSPPVLFVVTAEEQSLAERKAEAALLYELVDRAHARNLSIGPLGREEREELLVGSLGLDPDLARRVSSRTDGNPLFAVQLVGSWVQQGLLRPAPDGFSLLPGSSEELPDDLHAVWAGRVEALLGHRPDADRVALEIAAVLGQDVDGQEWNAACELAGVEPPYRLVETMIGRRLASSGTGDVRRGWAFEHSLFRESLERAAGDAGRLAEHHHCCADVVARSSGRGRQQRLGRHLMAAGQADEAISPLLGGVRDLVDLGDHAGGEALLGEVDRALAAAGLPGADRRRVKSWVLRYRIELMRGRYSSAARWAAIALAGAEQHDWLDLLAEAQLAVGWTAWLLGKPADAERRLRLTVDLAEDLFDIRLRARARLGLADMVLQQGRIDEASPMYEEALDHFHEGFHAGACVLGQALCARARGNTVGASTLVASALDLFERVGSVRGVARATGWWGELHREHGELDAAQARLGEAWVRFDRLALAEGRVCRLRLAFVELDRGHLDEARSEIEACLTDFAQQGWLGMAGCARAGLLVCAAADRDWSRFDECLSGARAALEQARWTDPELPRFFERAGELAAAVDENTRAIAAWRLARDHWTLLDREPERDMLGRRLAEAGDSD